MNIRKLIKVFHTHTHTQTNNKNCKVNSYDFYIIFTLTLILGLFSFHKSVEKTLVFLG